MLDFEYIMKVGEDRDRQEAVSPSSISRFAKRSGKQYKPVTHLQILEAVANWRTAESVGEELWPHLIGQGPMTGGPSSCAVAATFQLKRLEHAGKVISDSQRPSRYRRKT